MKKIIGWIFVIFFGLTNVNAMSYEEARERARFLTDKMAYELNLNDEQYNDAYEINLDYLMNIRTANDISGVYWEYRNADLRHILHDWQYTLFCAADYFFRPVIWRTTGGWFLPVCNIYPVTRFYYNPPRVYTIYRGGNFNYRFNHPVSFYANRRPAWHGGFRGESRGPVSRPGRHPVPPGHNGFRFEPAPSFHHDDRKPAGTMPSSRPGRPATTGRRPADNRGERTTAERRPTDNRTVTPRPAGTHGNPNTTRPTNRNDRGTSTYNRPSSTRTTVKQTPQSNRPSAERPQNRPNVQRSNNRPTPGNAARTTRNSSAPSRSGR